MVPGELTNSLSHPVSNGQATQDERPG